VQNTLNNRKHGSFNFTLGKKSLTELCAICAGERGRRLTNHVVSPRFVSTIYKKSKQYLLWAVIATTSAH